MSTYRPTRRSRLWAVLDALAYAGAFFDPTGALLAARIRNELHARDNPRANHNQPSKEHPIANAPLHQTSVPGPPHVRAR
jgi:hypothetical protein